MSNITKPTDAEDIDHDNTDGGTDGNPHADSASAADVADHAADNSAHHARYDDSEARTAVDGANVTVDNAQNLGGSPPSAYETPTSTQAKSVDGGYVEISFTNGSSGRINNTVDEIASTNRTVEFYFANRSMISLDEGQSQMISESHLTELKSPTFDGSGAGEVNFVSVPAHDHSI